MRGLKYQKGTPQVFCLRVAPFMGAWIEIYMKNEGEKFMKVAPFMGAWIEILLDFLVENTQYSSHPLWVRGLK